MTEETQDKPKMKTGFAVLVNEDGNMFVERNPEIFSIDLDREASLVEVRRFCAEIVSDLQAQAAAEYTVLRIKQLEKSAKAE
jgi:hypothetical protein